MLYALTLKPEHDNPESVDVLGKLIPFRLKPVEFAELSALVFELWPLLVAMLDVDQEDKDEIEYFSLGSIFKGIGKAVSGVANTGLLNFVPGVGPALQAGASVIGNVMGGTPIVGGTTNNPPPMVPGIPGLGPAIQAGVNAATSAAQLVAQPAGAGTEPQQAANEYAEYAKNYGPARAVMNLQMKHPQIFQMLLVMAEASKGASPQEWSTLRALAKDVQRDEVCMPCDTRLGGFRGRLRPGTFYRSRLVDGSVSQDLGGGVHGEVNLTNLPFKLRVSTDNTPARAHIALAHEIAHIANKLYKLGMTHQQVHDAGVFYATEGYPLYEALQNHLN